MIGKRRPTRGLISACVLACMLLAMPAVADAAVTIYIANFDGPGEGFNDPTPVAPVGGNPGTTLGAQRLNAFAYAASIWAARLNSVEPIYVAALFDPLPCSANSGTLGAAGPTSVFRDFPGAPMPATWYAAPLADARAGVDLDPTDFDMVAFFNSNLGQPGCLTGSPFYLGLDNNHGAANNLVTVLLHEFSHGFGFLSTTDPEDGQYLAGYPSAYDHFLHDNTQALGWTAMTPAQRAASAINPRRVAWTGPNVTMAAPDVLDAGTPGLTVLTPASIAGTYLVGTASFGPPPGTPGVTGEVMPVVDQPNGTGLACTPLNAANTLAVNGKIALIDRGVCAFTQKVAHVQAAGAIGVIVVDSAAGGPPPDLSGIDPAITITTVRITLADGALLKGVLRTRSRTKSGLRVTIGLDPTILSGTDALGRVLVYTPNPVQPGSSVSHWDTIATPNLLMEPFINRDLLHAVSPPLDLTLPLLRDIGWNP